MMQIAAYGRLGQDPKEITTKTGTAMTVASMAVTLADRSGEECTQWLGLVSFGRVAEALLKQSKGDMISVSGRAQHNAYTTPSGETREQLQIIADSIVSARTVRANGGPRIESKPRDGAPTDAEQPFDDAIPF